MAESKGALIAKTVQKHAGRAKEKLLQNLGKVDRTADEIFDEHVQNFTRQQNAANKLQKDLSNYLRCARALQVASKNLMDSLNEVYEPEWVGHEVLNAQSLNIEMLWQDFNHKLADQVLIPLNTYQSQFPEIRKKIEKRGRKMVDYDSQRHNFQSLRTNTKKRDEIKITRSKEQLEDAKRTYELLNSELHDELPALYDSRILFMVSNLQTLFAAEQVFHSESSKVHAEIEAIVDKLAQEHQRGAYTVRRSRPNSPKTVMSFNSSGSPSSPVKGEFSLPATVEEAVITNSSVEKKGGSEPDDVSKPTLQTESNGATVKETEPSGTAATTEVSIRNTKREAEGYEPVDAVPSVRSTSNGNAKLIPVNSDRKQIEELYDIPIGATTDNLPPGVLYRVRATFKYNREDGDELSFDIGDTIQVVEYEDPEEQEEGWLMGLKESSGEKGLFPANFTRPI